MIDQLKTAMENSIGMLFESIANAFPTFILVVILLLAGWLTGKLVKNILIKAMKLAGLEALFAKAGIDVILARLGINDIVVFIGKLAYWMVMLVFLIAISEVIDMPIISEGIAAFMGYLPRLLSALIILVLGIWLATMLKSAVYSATDSIGLSGSRIISNVVYYILFIFVVITAINQTGIDTSLITSNVTLIFGAMLLAFGISYGFASKNIMSNMLSSFYRKEKFTEGMTIRIDDVEGVIKEMDSLSITLDCGDKTVVLPTSLLTEKKVEILAPSRPGN
jgi:hypothetical protein